MSRACNNISLNTAAMKEQVYEFVRNIPRGKVATYGQSALHLGNRNFARVVGNILHSNPDPEHIRVIGWSIVKGSFHDHMRLAALRLKDAC